MLGRVRKAAFVSYAQNGEDVVLHRALGTVVNGRYIDVGANDPTVDSVTKAFYDAGWRGITVEPVHEFAARQRAERPLDTLVEAVITGTSGGTVPLIEIPGTGLSTLDRAFGEQHLRSGFGIREVAVPTRRLDDVLHEAGWEGLDIHFMTVDVEGAEAAVLGSLDLRTFRPWVVLAEATKPQTSESTHQLFEPLLFQAGYRFCLFDGLSRFYVAEEHWDRLHDALSIPAGPVDDFVRHVDVTRDERLQLLGAELDATSQSLREARDTRDAAIIELAECTSELVALRRRSAAEAAMAAEREDAAVRAAAAWRSRAVGVWADSVGVGSASDADELDFLRRQTHAVTQELTAIRKTLSWRITRPIRSVRTLSRKVGR